VFTSYDRRCLNSGAYARADAALLTSRVRPSARAACSPDLVAQYLSVADDSPDAFAALPQHVQAERIWQVFTLTLHRAQFTITLTRAQFSVTLIEAHGRPCVLRGPWDRVSMLVVVVVVVVVASGRRSSSSARRSLRRASVW
jgi:hypothetical protein